MSEKKRKLLRLYGIIGFAFFVSLGFAGPAITKAYSLQEIRKMMNFPFVFVSEAVNFVPEVIASKASQIFSDKIASRSNVAEASSAISKTENIAKSFNNMVDNFVWNIVKDFLVVETATTNPPDKNDALPPSTPAKTSPIPATSFLEPKQQNQTSVFNTYYTGISKEEVEAMLSSLNGSLRQEIYRLSSTQSNNAASVSNIYNVVSQSNRVDKLANTTITSPTISGGSISGVSIGATSGTFSGDVTGANLTTSGALSITGTGTSTASGDFAFDTNTLYVDSLNNRVGIGTSSPSDTLAINGQVFLANVSPTITTNRLYSSSGDLYWAGSVIGGATTGQWTTDGTNAWRATGNVGIGTTSPYAKLSVVGPVVAEYFHATSTTATSTIAGGLVVGSGGGTNGLTLTGNLLFSADNTYDIGASGAVRPKNVYVGNNVVASGVVGGTSGVYTSITGSLYWTSRAVMKSPADSIITLYNNAATDFTRLQFGGTTSAFPALGRSSNSIIVQNADGSYGASLGVGTSTPWGSLGIAGTANQTSPLFSISTSTASATSTAFIIDSNGKVGVGTSTPSTDFAAQGTAYFAGNVGIGTAGPSYPLHISTSASAPQFMMERTTAGGAGFSFKNPNYSWSMGLNHTLGGIFTIAYGTSFDIGNILNISASGLVGIGTTSPYAKLSVVGPVVAEYFHATSTTATSTIAGGLSVAGTSGLTVLQDGKVGIGTAGPSKSLTVSVANTGTLATFDGSVVEDGENEIQIGAYTDSSYNSIVLGHHFKSGTALDYGYVGLYDGIKAMSWDRYGLVGIGTTTPNWLLQVNGTRPSLALSDSSAGANLKHWLLSSMGGNLYVGTSTDSYGTSTPPALTITNAGNVGIGTAGPLAKLTIVGDPTNTTQPSGIASAGDLHTGLFINGNGNTVNEKYGIQFGNYERYGIGGLYGVMTSVAGFTIGDLTFDFRAATGDITLTERMRITSAGLVGIGTTSPYAKLSVVGPVVAEYFHATSTTATSTIAGGLSVAGTAGLTVLQNGNVGIGTAAPVVKLHIAQPNDTDGVRIYGYDDMNVAYGEFLINSAGSYNATANRNMVFTTSGAYGTYFRSGTDGIIFNDNSTNKIILATGGGNVGIGTTSPYAKLSVTNYTAATPSFALYAPNNGTANVFMVATTTGSATSTAFVIDSNGKVGMGTSTPWLTLSVQGGVAFSGLTTSAANQTYDLCMDSNNQVIADTVAAGCISSSQRFKRDINTLTLSALDEVLKLRPVSFYYLNQLGEMSSSTEQLGFIAEEALKIDPRLVGIGADGQPRTFKYENFTAILAKAIQELSAKVDELIKKVDNLASAGVASVKEWVGEKVTATVGYFGELVVDKLKIGSGQQPSGITMYDKTTGEPYCLEIDKGEIIKTKGTCSAKVSESEDKSNLSNIASTTDYSLLSTNPVITLQGNNPAEITLGTSYVDLGATAVDAAGQPLMPDMISSNVDTSKVGEYQVVWEAHDPNLNYASTTRRVIVSDPYQTQNTDTGEQINSDEGEQINADTNTSTTSIEEAQINPSSSTTTQEQGAGIE